MKTSTYLIRLTRLLVLGAVVAGMATSVAGAYDSRPPDVQDAARLHSVAVPTPRHVLDAVKQSSPNQVGLAWQYLRDTGQIAGAYDGRPPDVQDAMTALHTQVYTQRPGFSPGTESIVSRPPDVQDAAVASHTPIELTTTAAFDWGDWAIGLVAGFGLALGVAGTLLLAMHRIPRVRKTGAAAAG
jgi:hypothetical protein